MGRRQAWRNPQRSTVVCQWQFVEVFDAFIVGERTSLMSLPLSSEMSLSRRSLSASMPTDSRTSCYGVSRDRTEFANMLTLMSLAEGEVLPPRPRSRYAARCFILMGCEVV
jgi:hypothetical protein